jgi:hypothetical protein
MSIRVDHHVLQPAREHADPLGLGLFAVDASQQAKVNRYVLARDLLNSGVVQIPAEFRRLAQQLRDVVSRPTSGGGLQILLPRRGGVHGDICSAFVLALQAAHQTVAASKWTPGVSVPREMIHTGGF